jgi:hypothetical protein
VKEAGAEAPSDPHVSVITERQFCVTTDTVSAWTETGGGFAQVLSASDSSLIGGYVGIEGAGNISRTIDFAAGPLPPQ